MLYSALMFTLLALQTPVPSEVALSPQSSVQPVLHLSQLTTIDLNRAKNYARQAIETLNGGLGEYQAEDAMHGPSEESPYRDNGDGTWTFVFLGGEPGWTTPTIESEVTVDQGTGDVIVDYNGAIRNPEIVPADHQTPGGVVNAPLSLGITLNRAKNYARQAIEDLNGGLGLYQAEDVMHGPSEDAPYQDNGDGTWTFVFFGGAPGWTTPTIESEVTVNQSTGEVVVDYNGSPR